MSPLPAAPSRRVPLPTCDDLMRAVAVGRPACDVWSARFAEWSVPVAVSQIMMNALDPLLIETVLGPVESGRWLPLLREHYGRVKYSYPGEFANVEASWTDQRAWWMQFVEGAEGGAEASAGGGGGPGPPEPAPLGHAVVARSRQLPAPAPEALARPAQDAPPAPPLGGSARATPVAGAAHLPMEAPADAPAAPPPAVLAPASEPDRQRPSPSRVDPPPPRPVSPVRRADPAASPPQAAAAEPAGLAMAASRPGLASPGVRGRQLLEAASVSYDAVHALSERWAHSEAGLGEWGAWSLPSTLFHGGSGKMKRDPVAT